MNNILKTTAAEFNKKASEVVAFAGLKVTEESFANFYRKPEPKTKAQALEAITESFRHEGEFTEGMVCVIVNLIK